MDYIKETYHFQSEFPLTFFEARQRQMYMHLHDCLEINMVCSGKGFYLIEENKYEINPGDIFIINNRERHMAVHDGNLTLLVLIFDPQFIWDSPQEYAFLKPFFAKKRELSTRIRPGEGGYEGLCDCFGEIGKEYREKQFGWEMFVRAQVMLFLAKLYRYCNDKLDFETGVENVHRLYTRIRPALDYIHEHYTEEIELEILAKAALMNKNYLCTCFKETMNMRIFEYIDQLRINRACMLLKTSEYSITDISGMTGFNSVSYFNRSFKKVRGIAPSQYRKSE